MATFVYRKCGSCQVGSVVPDDERAQEEHACKECGAVGSWETKGREPRKWPGISVPDSDWNRTAEGHYCSYLEKGPSTKKSEWAHVRSVREMKEKLATMGLRAVKDGY